MFTDLCTCFQHLFRIMFKGADAIAMTELCKVQIFYVAGMQLSKQGGCRLIHSNYGEIFIHGNNGIGYAAKDCFQQGLVLFVFLFSPFFFTFEPVLAQGESGGF